MSSDNVRENGGGMTSEYGQTHDMLEGDDEDDECYIFTGRGKHVGTYVHVA